MIARTPRRRLIPHPGYSGRNWRKVPDPVTEFWEEPGWNYEFIGDDPPDADAPEDVREAWRKAQQLLRFPGLAQLVTMANKLVPEAARRVAEQPHAVPELQKATALFLPPEITRAAEALQRHTHATVSAVGEGYGREVRRAYEQLTAVARHLPGPDMMAAIERATRLAQAHQATAAIRTAWDRSRGGHAAIRAAAARHQRAPRRQRSGQRRVVRGTHSARGDPPQGSDPPDSDRRRVAPAGWKGSAM